MSVETVESFVTSISRPSEGGEVDFDSNDDDDDDDCADDESDGDVSFDHTMLPLMTIAKTMMADKMEKKGPMPMVPRAATDATTSPPLTRKEILIDADDAAAA